MNKTLMTSEVVDLLQIMFDICLKRKTEILDKMGITELEYDFFMFLNNSNSLSIVQIANHMSLAQAKVSRMTEKFIKKGYIRREFKENDQRSVRLIFTDKGEKMYIYAIENKCMGETRIKNILKEEKYNKFKDILREIVDKYSI